MRWDSSRTVFYRWQKEFFENGAAAFEQKLPTSHSADQERIAYLEKKIQTKDEVLAELEGSSPVLEEFLLPAVENRRLKPHLIAQLRNGLLLQQVPPQDGDLLFRRVVPSVASSCVRSTIFMGEHFLPFQLNRNTTR